MIKLLLTHNAIIKGDQTSIWGQPCLPWSQNTPSHNSGECFNIPITTICTNNNNATNNPTTTNKTLPPDILGACPWAPRSRLNPLVDLDPGHLGRPSIPLNPHRHPLQARLLQVIDLLLCEETSFHLKKGSSMIFLCRRKRPEDYNYQGTIQVCLVSESTFQNSRHILQNHPNMKKCKRK